MGGVQTAFSISQIHMDEIQGLPTGARLLASSPTCPVEAYAIGDHILCTQGHPEFSTDYMEFYIAGVAELWPSDKCAEWAASLQRLAIDTPRWHDACKAFLKAPLGRLEDGGSR